MHGSQVWRQIADQLDREAAHLESESALAGLVLPQQECTRAVLEQVTRSQWRDAGIARSLRDVVAELRDAGRVTDSTARFYSTSTLRIRSWLLARQVEHDGGADEAMNVLTRSVDPDERARLLARSAYALGRARGIRLATDIWNVATRAESRVGPAR